MVELILEYLIGQNTGLLIFSATLKEGQMHVWGFPALLNVV